MICTGYRIYSIENKILQNCNYVRVTYAVTETDCFGALCADLYVFAGIPWSRNSQWYNTHRVHYITLCFGLGSTLDVIHSDTTSSTYNIWLYLLKNVFFTRLLFYVPIARKRTCINKASHVYRAYRWFLPVFRLNRPIRVGRVTFTASHCSNAGFVIPPRPSETPDTRNTLSPTRS